MTHSPIQSSPNQSHKLESCSVGIFKKNYRNQDKTHSRNCRGKATHFIGKIEHGNREENENVGGDLFHRYSFINKMNAFFKSIYIRDNSY